MYKLIYLHIYLLIYLFTNIVGMCVYINVTRIRRVACGESKSEFMFFVAQQTFTAGKSYAVKYGAAALPEWWWW